MFLAQCVVGPKELLDKITREVASLTAWSYNSTHHLYYGWKKLGMKSNLLYFPAVARATMIRATLQTLSDPQGLLTDFATHDDTIPLVMLDEHGIFKGEFDTTSFFV